MGCRVARVAVLSAGSWGTTMAKVFADASNDVLVHARRDEVADAINTRHQNPRYLPDVLLPPRVRATTNTTFALSGAAYVVLSIPAQTLRENLAAWAPYIRPDTVVVSLMKGIETHSGLRMSEVIHEVAGIPFERIAVLSGPNLAREIAGGQPAASVIAC
ncbi:2-dehydropantoate 2-reductase N-terminal domain-containing protein, partial [Streptomyces sp. NPDC097610]|uniref:NAD(P)H-dependent glycerol-3-phosphate dehydrogenase n=1 Tax=Streptomyces sp. NPDC097610 TaxID=3157227 RepID=UPI003326EC30